MFMFYTDARVDDAAQSESCVQTGGDVDGETNNNHLMTDAFIDARNGMRRFCRVATSRR